MDRVAPAWRTTRSKSGNGYPVGEMQAVQRRTTCTRIGGRVHPRDATLGESELWMSDGMGRCHSVLSSVCTSHRQPNRCSTEEHMLGHGPVQTVRRGARAGIHIPARAREVHTELPVRRTTGLCKYVRTRCGGCIERRVVVGCCLLQHGFKDVGCHRQKWNPFTHPRCRSYHGAPSPACRQLRHRAPRL